MGTYVVVESEQFSVLPGHDQPVLRHVRAWATTHLAKTPSVVTELARATTVAQAFELLGFDVELGDDTRIESIAYDGKVDSSFFELSSLWGGLDRHMTAGSAIDISWEGDDDDEPEHIEFGERDDEADEDDPRELE
jgi:hypothetical protein